MITAVGKGKDGGLLFTVRLEPTDGIASVIMLAGQYMEQRSEPGDCDFDEDEAVDLYDTCPNCSRELDEIDYEYQICSWCKWDKDEDRLF